MPCRIAIFMPYLPVPNPRFPHPFTPPSPLSPPNRLGGTNAKDGGIYGSQGRDDYFDIDIEHYFNYTGALAIDGSYDRMYAFADLGLEPIDTILLLAAEENDFHKVEEVLEAGALTSVKDVNGKLPVELATKPEVVELLQKYMANQNVPLP